MSYIKSVGIGLTIGLLTVAITKIVSTEQSGEINIFKSSIPSTYSYAIEKSAPSVVNIFVKVSDINYTGTESQTNGELLSSGSGIIMSSDGLIITNFHVIMAAKQNTTIGVQLRDGKTYQANLIGYDRRTDIAVLKISEKVSLKAIPYNEKNDVHLGDVVLAIGNPYNLGQTITHGIISAVGRSGSGITLLNKVDLNEGIQDLIQTDAPINQGNSGGAVVNTRGEFVGISTATLTGADDAKANGISFAVPAKQAIHVLKEIIKNGKVIRGYLGIAADDISNISNKFPNEKEHYKGIIITSIDPNGPAHNILEPQDIVVSVNDNEVRDMRHTMELIADSKPGTDVNFTIIRKGEIKNVTVKVVEQVLN